MLPAFHGEQVARLAQVMAEVAAAEVERWPRDEPVALHPRLQALTLEVILRAVFGLEEGARLERLREHLTDVLAVGASPVSMLPRAPARPRARVALATVPAHARRGRCGALRAHRRTPRRGRRARRRPLAAARRAPRGRRADDRAGAARRADDPARRRPRDDGVAAGLRVRAPRAHAGGARPPDRGGRRRRRRRLPHGDRPGDPAPAPGAAQRRAAAGHAGDRGRRLALSRRASAWSPTPTSSTTTPRSTPSPTPSVPSASSTRRRAPTRGSRSAAGAGAASARRSPPWR